MNGNQLDVIDDPGTPDIFATVAASFFIHAGNVFISLETVRLVGGTEKTLRREVVGRVILPQSGAENLVESLGEFLKRQRQNANFKPNRLRPL